MRRIPPGFPDDRCPCCGVRLEGCFCSGLPELTPSLRFVFVQHPFEVRKPTGTARLVCRILVGSERRTWDRTRTEPPAPGSILLYPFPDAPRLASSDLVPGAVVAIPDGTWPQAARIANRLLRAGAAARSLPDGIRPIWSLRDAGIEGRISSGQAAAAALRIAGEAEAARTVEEAIAEASRRIRALRGLPSPAPRLDPP